MMKIFIHKIRKLIMKSSTLYVALAVVLLQGCTSAVLAVTDPFTGASGKHCADSRAKVGNIISIDRSGDTYKIISISGKSKMCPGDFPYRAELVKVI